VVIEMVCAMVRGRMGCSVVPSGYEKRMKTGRIATHMGELSARGSRRSAGIVGGQAPSPSLRAWPSRPGEIARHGWALGRARGGSGGPRC